MQSFLAENVISLSHPQILRQKIDERLDQALQEMIRQRAGGHVNSLHEALVEFVGRPGKRIRPLLFLYGLEVFQAGQLTDDLVSVAAGLEFLHAFVLVHDDLIDQSDTRRGFLSLHRSLQDQLIPEFNRERTAANLAMVFGDILFALAMKCIVDSCLPARHLLASKLLSYTIDTGYGEIADVFYGVCRIPDISVDSIELMYLLKTSRYTIECPLVLAGMVAGLSEEQLQQITRLSRPAGLAFQIQNDLKGLIGSDNLDATSDLLERKKTLLIRAAFDRLDEPDRSLLALCFDPGTKGNGNIRILVDLVRKSGAVEELECYSDSLFQQAFLGARSPIFPIEMQIALLELLSSVRRFLHTS
ncbi:MAG: polyprenyl synthetase family protein [Verrucomicrobia bacterium]|nr:polyprenyl synthetase family protein [Verrucomicrobiota bacterium]